MRSPKSLQVIKDYPIYAKELNADSTGYLFDWQLEIIEKKIHIYLIGDFQEVTLITVDSDNPSSIESRIFYSNSCNNSHLILREK